MPDPSREKRVQFNPNSEYESVPSFVLVPLVNYTKDDSSLLERSEVRGAGAASTSISLANDMIRYMISAFCAVVELFMPEYVICTNNYPIL